MRKSEKDHVGTLDVQSGIKVQTDVRAGDAVDDFAMNELGWDIEDPEYLGDGGLREVAEAWFHNTSPNPI